MNDFAPAIENNVAAALAEDIGSGDWTAQLIAAGAHATASVVCRRAAVLCGGPWFEACFRTLDPGVAIDWLVSEGSVVTPGQKLCTVRGAARALLTAERTALNFLQTLSAVATATRRYVDAVAGTKARIVDTRKTLPGLRSAEKYAVRVGGEHECVRVEVEAHLAGLRITSGSACRSPGAHGAGVTASGSTGRRR